MTHSGPTPEASALEEPIRAALGSAGLVVPEGMVPGLALHLAMTLKWNRSMSLTAITDPVRAIRLHVLESVQAAAHLNPAAGHLLDIGSGNGYPGLPIKMAHPEVPATLLEPALRKSIFLESVARATGLKGLVVKRERIEKGGDLGRYAGVGNISMRAVKVIDEVIAGAARFLPTGGRAILMLSSARADEVASAAPPELATVLREPFLDRREGTLLVMERI